jgi:hypothetical protein
VGSFLGVMWLRNYVRRRDRDDDLADLGVGLQVSVGVRDIREFKDECT